MKIWVFLEKSVQKIQASIESDNNNGRKALYQAVQSFMRHARRQTTVQRFFFSLGITCLAPSGLIPDRRGAMKSRVSKCPGFKFHYRAWPLHCDRVSFITSQRQRNYSCGLTKTTLTLAGVAPGVFHHWTVMTSNRCTLTHSMGKRNIRKLVQQWTPRAKEIFPRAILGTVP
jgi:hypothetical protein